MQAKFLTTVNVRSNPSTSSEIVAKYEKGERIMKRPTISNVTLSQAGCWACAFCGVCPGLTLGTAISGLTVVD